MHGHTLCLRPAALSCRRGSGAAHWLDGVQADVARALEDVTGREHSTFSRGGDEVAGDAERCPAGSWFTGGQLPPGDRPHRAGPACCGRCGRFTVSISARYRRIVQQSKHEPRCVRNSARGTGLRLITRVRAVVRSKGSRANAASRELCALPPPLTGLRACHPCRQPANALRRAGR